VGVKIAHIKAGITCIPTSKILDFDTAVQFQVCIQNRYKLNKKHRKLVQAAAADETDASCAETKALIAQAKVN